jgi:peptide/nickel transport system permease protein
MLIFILRRILAGIVLIFVITTLTFALLYAGSGDIARRILGDTATQQGVADKTAQLGLDRPLVVQYVDWLSHAVRGDLGSSYFTGQEVTEGISSRVTVTLSLVVSAIVLAAIVAVALGVFAALRRGWVDKTVQTVSVVGDAIPGFLWAIGLVTVFAINLGWFQPTGYVPLVDSFSGWIETITLPVIALAIGGIAGVTGQVRGSVIDALRQDYVRTLRSRGLPSSRVVYKHVLRNAGGPALAVLALTFVGMIGAAVVVEQVFAIPGLGQVLVGAVLQGDIPMVMGAVVAMAIIVVVVNLVIDLVQGWLNPKVRIS